MIKWKKASWGIFIASLYIIVPNCLKVDKAITFFISHSAMAERPATQDVKAAVKSRIYSRD